MVRGQYNRCEICNKRKAVAWLNKKNVCAKCFDIYRIGGVKENTIPKWFVTTKGK